jgi:hypothetical protein
VRHRSSTRRATRRRPEATLLYALVEAGDRLGAWELLMEALCIDLRCLDADAHLGNLEFEHSPQRAMLHYEKES